MASVLLEVGFNFEEKKSLSHSFLNKIKVCSLTFVKSSNRKYCAGKAHHKSKDLCSLHLVTIPYIPKVNWWTNMAAGAPAIRAKFQQVRRKKKGHLFLL